MLRLNTVGGNQSPQASWFSPLVTALSNQFEGPEGPLNLGVASGVVERGSSLFYLE